MTTTITPTAPALVPADGGEARDHLGNLLVWRVRGADTGGTLAVFEALAAPGGEPPIHVHEHEDETFHVLEGEVTFVCGGRELRAGPGATAFLPRGVPHGFRVDSATARVLCVISPAGFEPFFDRWSSPAGGRERPAPPVDVDVEAVVATLAEHGVTVVGPPPSAPGWGAALSAPRG